MARPRRQRRRFARRSGAARLAGALAVVLLAVGPAAAQTRLLSADDAVKLALQRNPSAGQAAAEMRAATGGAMAARSAILPQLSLGANYDNTIRGSNNFSSTGQRYGTEFWSGGASLDQTLISFPAWADIRAANGAVSAAEAGNQATRADVALLAYRQYYALLKAYKLKTVTTLSLKLRQDQLTRTQALFDLGSVARGDVLKQQVTVSQALQDDITANKNIVLQRSLLSAVLGLDIGEVVDIDTTLTATTIDVDSAAVFRDAMARRPELAEYRARLASARANLGGAQGGRYPSLTGRLRYSFTTGGFPEDWQSIDENASWSASLSLGLPVFDGLLSKGRIRQASARQLQAEYALQQQELTVVTEVQQALQAAIQAQEQIRVARDGFDAAQEDLKLTQEKYNVGSATVIELIDSQLSMTTAAVDLINALADAHIAQMQLRRARGEQF
jgi:outer membrane protein